MQKSDDGMICDHYKKKENIHIFGVHFQSSLIKSIKKLSHPFLAHSPFLEGLVYRISDTWFSSLIIYMYISGIYGGA